MGFRAVRIFRIDQEELEVDKPVLPEIEHLRGKVTDEQLEAIKDVLDGNEDVFRNRRQTLDVVTSLNTKYSLRSRRYHTRRGRSV